ncbi:MAG: hypothetical protein ABSA67_01655 [Candidatus Brocadiia bacterium]|jgi:hypothetical protein
MSISSEREVVRDLARRYADIAALPIQNERRKLWSRKNSLQRTRPLILANFGMWNVWCREVFGDDRMRCSDPFLRTHERTLRMALFQHEVGDDSICEPWITQAAARIGGGWEDLWGPRIEFIKPGEDGGAFRIDPPLKKWSDLSKLQVPHHRIDEAATAENVQRLRDVVGDILAVNADRSPACLGFLADISTLLARLRGLEQIMLDMSESPRELHALLAFMRDGILTNQEEAEKAGDLSLNSHSNQAMPYAEELEWPKANSGPRLRKQLWGYCAAQEFTLISPAMHDEFLLQYQLPILEKFGLIAYGCCENLTNKISILRKIPNLRIIAAAPTADLRRCAEQIGADYVISWRPNPSAMVCCGWNEAKIRRILREGLEAAKGCHLIIHLKDIETLEGDLSRLARWTKLVRRLADDFQ